MMRPHSQKAPCRLRCVVLHIYGRSLMLFALRCPIFSGASNQVRTHAGTQGNKNTDKKITKSAFLDVYKQCPDFFFEGTSNI